MENYPLSGWQEHCGLSGPLADRLWSFIGQYNFKGHFGSQHRVVSLFCLPIQDTKNTISYHSHFIRKKHNFVMKAIISVELIENVVKHFLLFLYFCLFYSGSVVGLCWSKDPHLRSTNPACCFYTQSHL